MMRRTNLFVFVILFALFQLPMAFAKDLEIKGKHLISYKPPFTSLMPAGLRHIYSFSHDNPRESSLTRIYFYVKEREKRAEELYILQIADKTNPQASPMTAQPLTPYTEARMYSKGKVKKGDLDIEYLTQLMAWNPEAKSLQPLLQKGIIIPRNWALQGQFLFIYLGEHAVAVRYSKDVHSFGMKVSEEGRAWEKSRLTGNEKRVVEIFEKQWMEIVHSILIRNE